MGAVDAARAAGFHPAPARVESDDSEAFGLVVAQEPAAGEEVARGAVVTLYVAAPRSAGHADADRPADGDLAGDPADGSGSEMDRAEAPAAADDPGDAEPPVEVDSEDQDEILEIPPIGTESPAVESGGPGPGASERRRGRPGAIVAVAVVAALCLAFAILLLAASQQRQPRDSAMGARVNAPQAPQSAARGRVRRVPRRARSHAGRRRHLDRPAIHVRRRGGAPARAVRRRHPAAHAQEPASPSPPGQSAPAAVNRPVPDEFF